MRIKLKVKHLISIGAFVSLLAVGANFWAIPTLQVFFAKDSDDSEAIIALLESNSLPNYKQKELIEDNILYFDYQIEYDLQTGPSMTIGPNIPLNENRTKYIEWYMEQANNQDEKYYLASYQLTNAYLKNGEWEKAEAFVDTVIAEMDEKTESYWKLYLKKVEILSYRDSDQAVAKINQALKSGYLRDEWRTLKVDILMRNKDYQAALETVSEETSGMRQRALLQNLKTWQSDEHAVHEVTGQVKTADGEAISYAEVYLKLSDTIGRSMNVEEKVYRAYTDVEGNYTIAGVPEGYYQLYLGIDMKQIEGYVWPTNLSDWIHVKNDWIENVTMQPLIKQHTPSDYEQVTEDEVTFSWERVEAAAYYQIGFGIDTETTGFSADVSEKFIDTSATISKDRIFDYTTYFGYSDDNIGVSLLGFAYPEIDIFWYVDAYREDGTLLSSSNGFRLTRELAENMPYFHIKRTLTVADQQLVSGNLEAAEATYKEKIVEDPEDTHSLRMLVRLALFSDFEADFDQSQQNARPYVEKLAKLTDYQGYWNELANLALDSGDWVSYFRYHEQAIKKGNVVDGYWRNRHAVALMKNGQLEKAESLLRETLQSDRSHEYMPELTALVIYQQGSFEEAQQLSATYPILPSGDANWETRIIDLKQVVETDEIKAQQFETGLKLYISGDVAKFNAWLVDQPDGYVKSYLVDLE